MSVPQPCCARSHCLHRPRVLSGFRDLLVPAAESAALCPAHPPPCHCSAGSTSPSSLSSAAPSSKKPSLAAPLLP